MGSPTSSSSESSTVSNDVINRLGRTLRDRITQELESKLAGRTGQINNNEIRDVLQQMDFSKFIREVTDSVRQQQSGTPQREESTSART